MAAPLAIESNAIACGCRSVGNPGYGSVTTSNERGRSCIRTRKPPGWMSICAPAVTSLSSAISRCCAFPPATVMSPWVMVAAIAHVPATMRSATALCRTGCNASTPSISSVDVPMPSICAPIATNIWHRSTISGSRAALSIAVLPLASTAAISRFSVAPTLGKSSQIVAPVSVGASATTNPCSIPSVAPIRSSPAKCMSSLREPMLSPPGSATLARPVRASSGPSTQIEARILRTSSYGASEAGRSGTSMTTPSPPSPSSVAVVRQPSRCSN